MSTAPSSSTAPSVVPRYDPASYVRQVERQDHPLPQHVYPTTIRSFLELAVRPLRLLLRALTVDHSQKNTDCIDADPPAGRLAGLLEQHCVDRSVRDQFVRDYSIASREKRLADAKASLEQAQSNVADMLVIDKDL